MNIVCIYTHEDDTYALNKLKSSRLYKKIKECSQFKVLEVLGDKNLNEPLHIQDKLYLDFDEDYSALSIKTFKMIKYCVENFAFNNIIKIDANILDYSCKSNLFLSESCLNKFYSEDAINSLIFHNSNRPYFGLHIIGHVSKESFKLWATNKKLENINYYKEFIDEKFPSFYTGKMYGISYDFAKFISQSGEKTAYNHKKNLGGVEDVFVGRMFSKFYMKNWIYEEHWKNDYINSVQNH